LLHQYISLPVLLSRNVLYLELLELVKDALTLMDDLDG
jgi:hypothetical protein